MILFVMGIHTLAASATNYNLVTWSTSGDGTFSNTNILNPVYTPGVNDIANGTVDLHLQLLQMVHVWMQLIL